MKPVDVTIEAIDALLPQTQCKDCTYDGCLPYAEAIKNGEATLDLCLPGGVKVMRELGKLLQQDVSQLEADMAAREKPKTLAVIREDECIGCTKCIQACPVDAIFGASKQMHTVISSECTGCVLCVEPCPMDCIDMVAVEDQNYNSDHARQRFQNRNARLAKQEEERRLKYQNKVLSSEQDAAAKRAAKKAAIAAAIARSKGKK